MAAERRDRLPPSANIVKGDSSHSLFPKGFFLFSFSPCIEIPMFVAPSFPLSFLLPKSICWSSRASYTGGWWRRGAFCFEKKGLRETDVHFPDRKKEENEEKGTNTAFLPPNSRHFPNKNIFSFLVFPPNGQKLFRACFSIFVPPPLLQTHTHTFRALHSFLRLSFLCE